MLCSTFHFLNLFYVLLSVLKLLCFAVSEDTDFLPFS